MSKGKDKYKLVAYGVVNDQGYWVGIYKSRETAQLIVDRGVTSHQEKIVELFAKEEN